MYDIPKEVKDTIKKYVSSFEKKYHLGIKDDAFQEGVIAYLQALRTYDASKGKDISKWVNINIYNTLRKVYNKEEINESFNEEEIFEEENELNITDELCNNLKDLSKKVNLLEKIIFVERLKGNSFQSIAREINYPKNKIQNIFETIIAYLKG